MTGPTGPTGPKNVDTPLVLPDTERPESTETPVAKEHGETFERTGSTGRRGTGDGLETGGDGVRLGQTTGTGRGHGSSNGVNLQEAEAAAQRLADGYYGAGFGLKLLEELRGKPTVQQRHILNKMNAKVKPMVMARHAGTFSGVSYILPRDDIAYFARMEMTSDDQAVLDAYLRNPSGRLEDHDQIYLSQKGLATFEEGILQPYRGKSDEQIKTMEARYLAAYGETVDDALAGGLFKELNSEDRARWQTLRLGTNNLTPAHFAALDVHLNSAAIAGTRDEALFGTLAKGCGCYGDIAKAYQEIFEQPMTPMLRDELDDVLSNDTNELNRLDALIRGDAEGYLAHTIMGDELDAADLAGTVFGMVGSGKVSADFIKNHDGGRLLRELSASRDPRLQGMAQLIGEGHDLRASPGTFALQLRAVALEVSDRAERVAAFSDIISTIPTDPPTMRGDTARQFEKMFGQSLESYVRRSVRELPKTMMAGPGMMPVSDPLADATTNDRVQRLMREWSCDRSSESLMLAFRDGVAQPGEFLSALRALPPGQRSAFAEAFDATHGEGLFQTLIDRLPKKDNKAAKLEMKLNEVAKGGNLEDVEELVHHMIEEQRFGNDRETRWSAGLMDTFGQTGVLLDESARNLFDRLRELEHQVEQGHEVTPDQQAALNDAFVRFTGLYTEYLGEKEDVATTAGTVVAMGVALAVPGLAPAVLGVHGGLAAGAVAAGVAKVGVKNAIYGGDYDVISWKAAKDFGTTVAIEMVAGEIAHGAVHLLGHGTTKAGEALTHGYVSATIRGGSGVIRVATELGERAAVRIGMDIASMVGANATFGNFRMLGASQRIAAPQRPR